jgi:ATP-dependent Lon protease
MMNGLFGFLKSKSTRGECRTVRRDQTWRQVNALFGLLSDFHGSDKLVLKAGKLGALKLMRSDDIGERVLCLERLVYENPTLDDVPVPSEIQGILEEIEDRIADMLAKRSVEDKVERKVNEHIQKRQDEYMKEIRMRVLRDDDATSADNAQTLKKYAELEKLDRKRLTKSAYEMLRPGMLEDVVGQNRAIKALLSKLATPYPQHVILYGPPGVGKTSVARLVLEKAKALECTPFEADAKFIEVDGTTLRWDPREITNPLLGSVHDPIYQGARRDYAEIGIPEPKPGLVTDAHGGILFIDEIGELDPALLNKLLKVMEDKRVSFESAYYDELDPKIPKYIKKLFDEGAPADFILIGATTRDPESISPAIRSRSAEIFFEPLTPGDIQDIIINAAKKLDVQMDSKVAEIISDYTIEGRKAVNILADAYGLAVYEAVSSNALEYGKTRITSEHVYEVVRSSRLSPYVLVRATDSSEVGKVFGLGVMDFIGSIIEFEAVAFKASKRGAGTIRFNETAGSMTKDSVFNASAVVRKLLGADISDYDIHVNVIGGGRIDGPSAGVAILMAIISAIDGYPVRQDVAITGEISIQGKVKAVGGIFEKIYGARQAGIRKVIIPKENEKDIPSDLQGIEVICVSDVSEVMNHIFEYKDVNDSKRRVSLA